MRAHWPISILSTLSSLVSMALPLILVRTLTPSELGSFKIFFLYLMVLPPLTFIAGVSNGLSYWAGRGEAGKKAIRNSAILFLVISAIAFAALFLLTPFLSAHLHLETKWIRLFSWALCFGIASMFYDDAAIATGRIWTGALFNAGFEFFRTGVIVLTAIFTHDLFAIVQTHIIIQMLKMISGYALAYHQDLFRFEWNPDSFRAVVRYAFPVSLAFVFGLWLNYSDQIILSEVISTADFALYSVCCLTVPPLLVLEASVTRVLIPQLSQAFAEERTEDAARLYRNAVKDLAFLIIPATTGMIIFAAPVIELLFTKTYLPGTHYLRLYAFWYLTLMLPPDSVARAQGKAKWILGNFVFFSTLTLVLCFGLAQVYGAIGAMTGLLLARFASRYYTAVYLHHTLKWNWSQFLPFQAIGKITIACVSLGAMCWLLRPFFHSPLTWFLVTGGGFSIAYLWVCFFTLFELENRKVLMLTPGLFIGGLERMILNLSKGLKQSSLWQPQVWAYDFAPVGAHLVSSFQRLQIPVHSKTKPPRFSFQTAAQIAKQARHEGIHVIHTHDLGALIYGALTKVFLLGQVRLVHTQHSFVHLNRSWKYRYYEKFFTLFADSIAVVSPDTRLRYRKLGVSNHKLHLIPNGVDFPETPDLNRELRIQKRTALLSSSTPNEVWILYLARIHGRKGQDHALRLWAELSPSTRESARLIFVGPETEAGALANLETLLAQTPHAHRVQIVGPSQNPQEWIRNADLFLSCSEFEGMPLAPIEAVGSGVPALLSDIAGHDFLKSYASFYSLQEPEVGVKILEGLCRQVLEEDITLRLHYWQKTEPIRSSFTLSAMSKQYEKLYERFE